MQNKVRVFDDLIKIERHKPIFAGGYHDWEIKNNTLNYEKAINIVAKTLCQHDFGGCGKCEYSDDEIRCDTCLEVELYKHKAEAALNALLSKEK